MPGLMKLLRWFFYIIIVVVAIHMWLSNKSYLFPENITKMAIAKKDKLPATAFRELASELRRNYPGHILPDADQQWIFMNAGGWMGSVCIVHASLTEYVLFFGTAVDTVGHSGRYWANVTDTLISGEFRQWAEGEFTATVHKPGATIKHVWGEATAVNFKAGTWMMEYGRGFIPSTLGFALGDTIFSTQDFLTMFYIIRVYTKAMMLELCTSLGITL